MKQTSRFLALLCLMVLLVPMGYAQTLLGAKAQKSPQADAFLAYENALIARGLEAARPYMTADKVVAGWLASPGHCANLMTPAFSELGAGYAVDPKSDAGIYWTALFGAP